MKIQCAKCGKIYEGDSENAASVFLCGCGAAMMIPPYAKYADKMKEKSFKAKLSGMPYYNPALDLFREREEKQIALEFDSENIYDGNAIRVLDKSNYALLGYVDRHVADEVGHIGGEVVGLSGTLQIKSKNNIIVDFICYYVPYELYGKAPAEDEKIIVSCPLCNDKRNVDSSVLGKTIQCLICGAKWRIMQWWTNPQKTEFEDIGNIFSNAEIQYQPKSTEIIRFPALSEINSDCRFLGKCVLFTGFYPEEKEQIAPIVDFLRINQSSVVCRKLDFLVCGSNPGPSKIKKAEEMGKTIIQAADFIQEITGHAPRKHDFDDFQDELL